MGEAGRGKLAQLIQTRGGKAAPEAPFTIEHREALIYMLCEASELEHGIMCQYLFAAFSLKQSLDEGGLSAAELEAVTRWRKQISHVATQEMLHLALVNNILSAIGAAPHLSRVNLPALANHYPAGVQLALLPFGEEALRHFMFLERPEGMDLADAEGMEAFGRAEPLMAEHDIVPRSQDFATVGHLYRSIEAGLAHLSEKFGERALFVGPPRAQATSANFRWPELIPVTSLESACRAVGEILEQGEGPRGDWKNAHFGQFVAILDEYLALKAANPSFDPVRPVLAVNVRPLEHADVPLVTDTLTARCMDLFNVGNEVLLQALERYFAHTEETDEQLETLAELALGLMFSVIKPLGDLIPTLPAGAEYPGRTAAPSFELFYESDYLMPHRSAAWALLEERLREASAFAERCRTQRAADVPAVASVLGQVGGALDRLADSLAAHFADWGAVSRFAAGADGSAVADVSGLLTEAGSLAAHTAGGPYAGLAADAHALATSAGAGAPLIARLVNSVLRPLAGSASTAAATATSTSASADGASVADQLRALALAAARLRAANPDPALQEANAALQDLAITAAPDPAALITELRSIQAGLEPGITVAIDGPYLVTNAERLRSWLGEPLSARPQLALCRCGQSAIKPFCDGSHVAAGFSGEKDPRRVPDRRDTYPGQQLTVFDNRGICQHAGYCTDRLPSVFHSGGEPFVTAAGGRLDDIVAATRACPSGALSFAIDAVEERATVDWHGTREPAIEVSKDGPYRITGGLPLAEADGTDVARAQGSSREHYALCRCGHSQNKPFCSGMHWYVGFADPAPSPRPTLFEWAGGIAPLTKLAALFFEKHAPEDPVLGPLYASAPPGQAARAAARIGAAFGGPRTNGPRTNGAAASTSLAGGLVPEEARGRWTTTWLRCADEAGLPADPQFRSAFAAYVTWECAAPDSTDAPSWDWGVAGPPSAVPAEAASVEADGEPVLPGPDETVSFTQHIKPLFRELDRKSMSFAFDLWSYADVSANAAGVLDRVTAGTMPCDGAWPAEKVDVFRRWTESGMAELPEGKRRGLTTCHRSAPHGNRLVSVRPNT
jgi:CDGSH-type Zn-finger protein/truncated hemoglobin YjbI